MTENDRTEAAKKFMWKTELFKLVETYHGGSMSYLIGLVDEIMTYELKRSTITAIEWSLKINGVNGSISKMMEDAMAYEKWLHE